MASNSNDSLWRRIYTAWLASGKRKCEFYADDLPGLWPAERPLPSVWSFYRRTRLAELELELAQAPAEQPEVEATAAQPLSSETGAVSVRKIGRNFQIVEADTAVIRRALSERIIQPEPDRAPARPSSPPPLQLQSAVFRMTLADGAVVEFATPHPEELALQMYAFARRAA